MALRFLFLLLAATTTRARAQGLVAAYPFDEGNGSTVTDVSGNGNNGTLQNAVWTAGGKFGGALVFNGTNAKVAIPDSSSLEIGSTLTIEAWVYPTIAPTAWRTFVHKETQAVNVNDDKTPPLPAHAWTHVAVTRDGASLRLYVNGGEVSVQAVSEPLLASPGPLSIGGDTPYGEYFNGRIDEVRVYNRALSGAEIRTDMLTPLGSAAPYAVDWNTASAVDVTVANATAADPSTVGQWAGPFAWPLVSVHTTLMPNGKVLMYDDHTNSAGVQVWDPIADTLTSRPYNSANLFCSGHTVLVDGRVFVVGGHVSTLVGLQASTIFNPTTQAWSAGPSMTYGRWYPTATALPNGKILATSGAIDCPTCGNPNGSHDGIALIPEIYDPNTNSWSQLSGASLSLPLYPHMHVLPDGRVFAVSTQEDPIVSKVLDLTAQTWTTVDPALRNGGSSVMYRPGKILKSGSARSPDYPAATAAATAWVIDMNLPSPTWRSVAPMTDQRTQHNLTMLPDGNVLLVGGGTTSDVYATSSAVKPAALWSPATETWTPLAAMSEPRLYHSTALLLPDARVMVSGGGRYGPDFPSAELFSPPYLFKGPRPTITSAPAVVQYNSHFVVGTPNGAGIAKVTLLRLGSVTHAFDQNQRYVELSFAPVGGGLDVTAPTSLNIVPPGHYMLFLVDTTGIPSVSSIVRFPAPWEDAIPPTAPSNLAASPSPGKVTLTWSSATDNLGVVLYNVHRGIAPNVTPSPANRIGQSQTTAFDDTGFATGTYYYVVTAQDANGNVGVKSNEVAASATADATPPTVAVTVPTPNAILSEDVTVTATAGDDVGVAGVQFLLDGASFGAEDIAPPFAVPWDTVFTANGAHTVSARARDARGNLATATNVPVAVSNGQAFGLVAAYSFDEGAGTLAFDSSGAGNRGTVTNATWTASGHYANALSFDGTTDYVRATNSSSLNIAGAGLTIEMWANITAGSAADYALLAKPWTTGITGNPPYQYGIEYDANGLHTLDFYFGDTTSTARGPYSMTPSLGVWTHLAYTFDGTAVKAYLDGVLKLSTPIAANIQARPTDLLIGVDGSLGQGFKGKLDDVRLYNRALTQTEIQLDMGRPAAPAVPPVPDGSFGTAMKATRATVDGSTINLTWDVAGCAGKGYHTVYGPLANLATYQVGGGACGMGTTGSFSWTSAPAGDVWFVVVADDLIGTEGSWGTQSAGGAMNGFVPSSACGNTNRVNLSTCP